MSFRGKTNDGDDGDGRNNQENNDVGNVPFFIARMQRETNEQFTQLQLKFKREHEEKMRENEKMRDAIERLTRVKDDLLKSLTLMTKERDAFREKAMGKKLKLFPNDDDDVDDDDDRKRITMIDPPSPPPPNKNKNKKNNDDENEDEKDSDDEVENNDKSTTLISQARFQKLQAELMIYREAAAKYRKEKEVALSKLEKYEKRIQQQQRGKQEHTTAKRKRPHSPASKYAVFVGEEYTTKDEELEEIANREREKDFKEKEQQQRQRRRRKQYQEMHDGVDDEFSAGKNNDNNDHESFSFNRRDDFWAFNNKNDSTTTTTTTAPNAVVEQHQQQTTTVKPKPKKHIDASKMMMPSKRASLDPPGVGARKKGTAATGTASTAKKGVSKKVQSLWDDAMKKKKMSDTKTPPPSRTRAMFETPKTNEAQINKSTPIEEEVLVIKNTQDEDDDDEEDKQDKEVKRTKRGLRKHHQEKANKSLVAPDKPLREVKYQEVVRGKEARKQLIGYACQECERFYAVAGQLDRRTCEHGTNALSNNNNNNNSNNNNINDNGAVPINLENSRHRAKYLPPKDPAGYWDLGGFTQTQPDSKKKKTKFDETPPSQENW